MKSVKNKSLKNKKSNYTDILLEKMNDNIKLVAEGQIGLERRFGVLEAKFDNLEIRMGSVEARLGNVENRLGAVEANQKVSLEYLFRIDEKIEEMEKELKDIKSRIIHLEAKGSPKEASDFLLKRVEKLEKEMEKYKILINTRLKVKTA